MLNLLLGIVFSSTAQDSLTILLAAKWHKTYAMSTLGNSNQLKKVKNIPDNFDFIKNVFTAVLKPILQGFTGKKS